MWDPLEHGQSKIDWSLFCPCWVYDIRHPPFYSNVKQSDGYTKELKKRESSKHNPPIISKTHVPYILEVDPFQRCLEHGLSLLSTLLRHQKGLG